MTKLTDKEAVKAMRAGAANSVNVATQFVKKTVLYPVTIEYSKGNPINEIRTFVRAGEYASERQMELAAELEKEYPELQKDYRAALKAAKLPIEAKEYPLRATVLE